MGYEGLLDNRLSTNDSRKAGVAAISHSMRGMPWNGKEEKIMGTGCNHELMVATKKRNPVNRIFYLSEVISPIFLASVRTVRPRKPLP